MSRVAEQSAEVFAREVAPFRKVLAEEVLGRIDDPVLPADPRSRKVYDTPKWTGYEVVLDVYPDVFAWGVLLVPKDIKEGERRPVVVCQHGRNGLPKDVIEGDLPGLSRLRRAARRARIHHLRAAQSLPRRGPLPDAQPQGEPAEALAVLVHHGAAPADPRLARHAAVRRSRKRIAFYGLSYGGETAMRVPPLLEGYCLSICSGDFNDWARKVASTDSDYSFMFTVEWEMPYFNMGSTFNYAEMAYLMVPRPFMVERGPPRRRGPGRVGGVGIREGPLGLRQPRPGGPDRHRVLQRRPHHPRPGDVRLPAPAPGVAEAGAAALSEIGRPTRATRAARYS